MIDDKYRIIGITGKKFSGKDTLGNYFVQNYNYEQIAYADAIKDAVKCIFDFDDEQLHGLKKEEVDEFWGKTPRQVLQFVGTDLFRNHTHELLPNIGKDIWIQVVKRKIMNRMKKDPNLCFVITDARFHNEVDVVKQLGGTVIKLQRHTECQDNHESETLIDTLPADYEFKNNSTKEELYDTVTETLKFNK
jgi:shikimate kinase